MRIVEAYVYGEPGKEGQRLYEGTLGERVGTGWRPLLVLSEGNKYAHLFYYPTLTHIEVPLEFLRYCKDADTRYRPKKLLQIIKRNKKERDRLGIQYSGAWTDTAIEQLKEIAQ